MRLQRKFQGRKPARAEAEARLPGARGRRLGMGAAAGLLAVAITAVTGTPVSAAASTSKLTGNLSMYLQYFEAPELAPAIKAWEAANPGVHVSETVSTSSGSPTAYQTSLLTEKLAGDLPDIVNPQDVLSPLLSSEGITQSLSPYLAKGEPYPQSHWLQNILASYIPTTGPGKGQVFALPLAADGGVVYYNEKEFKAAGVPLPSDNWTWSQMLADAAKLKVTKGGTQTQWGLCDTPDWQAVYNPLMADFGVTSLSETKADLASPGALKAWQMLITPTQDGDAVPYSVYLSAGSAGGAANCSTFFESGEASMFFGNYGQVSSMRPATAGKFGWGAVPMPIVQGAHGPTRPTGGGSAAVALSSQAKDITNALAFLKYVFSSQGQAILQKGYTVVPAVVGGSSAWEKLPPPPDDPAAYAYAAKTLLVAPQTPSVVCNLTQIDVPKAIEKVVDEHESYAQAFGALNTAVNAAYPKS
jgi:multiple sugar transport system substrate-binding protein